MKRLTLMLPLLCLAALPVPAQMPSGNIAQIIFTTPKAGHSKAYEAGRKLHMAWHKGQKDTWSWQTWEVLNGDNAGTYVTGTFGREWKDFDGRDKFEAADTANVELNMGPHTQSAVMRYYTLRTDISLAPNAETQAYDTVIEFSVKPESVNAFIEGVKKVNEGIRKTNYPVPPSRWYQLVNGGKGPLFVLVQDRATFADMQGPAKSLDDMMGEAFGKEEGAAILSKLRNAYHHTESSMVKYRPDLSYVPK